PHHIKIMQTSVGKALAVDRGARDILLEDTISDGGARAHILLGRNISNIIVRRCVIRQSYADSREPTAMILMYGAGFNPLKNIEIQNCIILDQSKRRENFESASGRYGAIEILNGTNISIRGTIVLNIDDEFFFDNKNSDNVLIENSVFWDTKHFGFRIYARGDAIPTNNHLLTGITSGSVTFSGVKLGFIHSARAASRIESSLFANIKWRGEKTRPIFQGKFTSTDNNVIANIDGLTQGNVIQALTEQKSSPLKYIVDSNVTDNDGKPVGAKVLKRYGVSGSMWGEPGYNAETAEPLWPFPQEDRIKREMAEFKVRAGEIEGFEKIEETGMRGLVNYVSPHGSPNTLSAYIWEYLGNKAPEDKVIAAGHACQGQGSCSPVAKVEQGNLLLNIPSMLVTWPDMLEGKWIQAKLAQRTDGLFEIVTAASFDGVVNAFAAPRANFLIGFKGGQLNIPSVRLSLPTIQNGRMLEKQHDLSDVVLTQKPDKPGTFVFKVSSGHAALMASTAWRKTYKKFNASKARQPCITLGANTRN
ncbi:MAG: right-handed parallel beta-helix repeat-containing protein, partial [Pseudomonadota bacterium]